MWFLPTQAQMRQVESLALQRGATESALISSAGEGLLELIKAWDSAWAGWRYVLLVGPGNNGADALALERHLRQAGADVVVWDVLGQDAERQGPIADHLDAFLADAEQADLIVDGFLGMGGRPLREADADWVRAVNGLKKRVLAIDLPSGIAADSGQAQPVALQATKSLAMGMVKRGLMQGDGFLAAGEIWVHSMDLDQRADAEDARIRAATPTRSELRAGLAPITPGGHKGSYGKVAVLGGSPELPGAVGLAGQAAYRAGAGLVTAWTEAEVRHTLTAPLGLTYQTVDLLESEPAQVAEELALYDALVIGPGWGQTPDRQAWLRACLNHLWGLSTRLVVDADGLNALDAGWLRSQSANRQADVWLTPHPLELARLLGSDVASVQADRYAAAGELAAQSGVNVLLKGAPTLLATADAEYRVVGGDVPALSVAGSGDVLAGVLAAMLASQVGVLDAAQCAVYSHAATAYRWQQAHGQRGMLADDLLAGLPSAIEQMRRGELVLPPLIQLLTLE